MSAIQDHLQPDEEVTYLARPTQLTLFPPLLATIVILGSALAIFLQTGSQAVLIGGAIIGGIGVLYLLQKLIILKSNQYVVTSRRIIKQTGIFSKSSVDTYLDKINNVEHYQSLWGRLLGYGNVEVDTASETGMTQFPMVARPLEFKQAILTNAQQYRSRGMMSAAPAPTGAERLRQLKGLLDDGLITQIEFEEKRKKLLEQL
jgi:uncharacterized membrane protein YdbT with pleckstrin-like domain